MMLTAYNHADGTYYNSHHSTCGASHESQMIKNVFLNEWYKALNECNKALMDEGAQVHSDTISDYQSPGPLRSYKIKIRVISKVKGQPADYEEN